MNDLSFLGFFSNFPFFSVVVVPMTKTTATAGVFVIHFLSMSLLPLTIALSIGENLSQSLRQQLFDSEEALVGKLPKERLKGLSWSASDVFF